VVDPPINEWIAGKPDLAVINYDAYLLSVSGHGDVWDARASYYGGYPGGPVVNMDGSAGRCVELACLSVLETMYQARKAIPPRVEIELSGAVNPDSGAVTAHVTALEPLPGEWRLRMAITEDNVFAVLDSTFSHLLRDYIGGVGGTEVAFAAPYPCEVTVTKGFDVVADGSEEWMNWDWHNLTVVAFLQDEATKEIEQSAKLTLSGGTRVQQMTWGRIKSLFRE
jgi:hypothetical protein